MNRFINKLLVVFLFVIASTSGTIIGYSFYDNISQDRSESLTIGEWLTESIAISNAQEFYNMVINPNSISTDSYYLTNNIDFTGFSWIYDSTNFDTVFRGQLNGNGYSLDNLTIYSNNSNYSNFGIFPQIEGATIINLVLNNIDLSLGSSALSSSSISSGLIAGGVIGSTNSIQNITILDSGVRGTSYIGTGGLIGYISGSTTILNISNVLTSNLKVFSNGAYVGGLVGSLESSGSTVNITDIDLNGEVFSPSGSSYTGGVIGNITSGSYFNLERAVIEQRSQNTLETSQYYLQYSSKYLGGIIGFNQGSSTSVVINNVFFTGELITQNSRNGIYVGTFIGRNKGSYTFTNSYYSQVLFITRSGTTYNSTSRGVDLTLVSSSSMPSLTWWNSFATSFYNSNSLWTQDVSGRLKLSR